MATSSNRSIVYFDPVLRQALQVKSKETSRSMSEIINEAVKEAFAEDAEAFAVFEERDDEPLIGYEQRVKGLEEDG